MNYVRSFSRSLLMIFCGLLYVVSLSAQSDVGSITGFVRDPSGATVPNAKVTVRNEATGVERVATSNESGFYTVTNIPSALYTVTAEASGFKRFESAHNKLDPNSTLAVDAALTVGAATETVEVTASPQQVQSESAAVQKLITTQQIESLELNGRNPVLLAQLQPGVRGGALAGLNFGLTQGPSNINGSRNQENLITFDGAPATRTRSNGAAIGAADVDSTQEIQILTAAYNAEYGRTSGGQIRIISRSGTQQFHGALYEYFRNDALNANSWSRNSNPSTAFVPPFHYNQFGFAIGGPVIIPGTHFNHDRNKLFWFWGTEFLKYNFLETAFQTVPTDLMRQGNFSELLNPSNPFYGKAVTIYDPSTCPVAGASTCQAFSNNVIPANRLSQNGIALLRAYPAPEHRRLRER